MIANRLCYRISLQLLVVAIVGLGSGCELLAKIPTSPKMPSAFEYPLLVDQETAEFPKASTLAEKLGYTPPDLLVKRTNCTPASFLMPTVGSCYLYFIFEMIQTVDAFGTQFPQLPLKATDFYKDETNHLFEIINIGRQVGEYKRLSFAGNDGSTVEQSKMLPKIHSNHWQFEDEVGKRIEIDFYETASLKPALDLGGSPIEGNVVVIGFAIGLARLQ